ncbi:MAG: formylglycine-generating enzyme family protein [Prevotellaceae bacterium]|nr:formylglycine-generating enzyme family protein [Prevotellaceae bacterium]
MFFIFCVATAATAQKNSCYDARYNQGIDLFNKGDYATAKKHFSFAMSCAYITPEAKAEARTWLQKCDDALAGNAVQPPDSVKPAGEPEVKVKSDDVAPQEKEPSSAARKAVERAQREAAARAAAAAAKAREREQAIEKSTAAVTTQEQTSQFSELMLSADSMFNMSDYKAAENAYKLAALAAQMTGNQNNIETALAKIDCSSRLSTAYELMELRKFDEAREKFVAAKSVSCIDSKRVDALISQCDRAIAEENEMVKTNIIAPIAEDMVLVKGGIFMMGCEKDCKAGETPVHQVVLKNFYISKHEVTQAQWEAVMGNNPSPAISRDFPVTNVSWTEIQEFIIKLNAASGLTYRLPTEPEWEYAARGGNKSRQTIYSGSDIVDDVAWFSANSGNSLSTIGVKEPNELEIFDMSGNAAEWCNDWRSDYTGGFHLYPVGPKTGTERIVRGGGYSDSTDAMRVFFRASATPDTKSPNTGFRLASNGLE